MSLTRAQILAEIAANLPDNNSEAITPAIHRATLGDVSGALWIYSNDAYIVVATTDDPVGNGLALIAAYQAAAALTPNGLPLALDNTAAVIVPPGRYEFIFNEGEGEWQTLAMLNNFVNLIGLTGNPSDVFLTSACDEQNSGTVVVAADFAVISGVTIENTGDTRVNNDQTDASALCVAWTGNGVTIKSCAFYDGGSNSWGMRQGINIGGIFEFCSGVSYCFGSNGGSFNGLANNCTSGDNSFGHLGGIGQDAVIRDCTAGESSFGKSGNLFGKLFNCIGGDFSFASGGTIKDGAFLFSCKGGQISFGNIVELGSVAIGCFAQNRAFGFTSFAGTAIGCKVDGEAFGINDGTFSGNVSGCVISKLNTSFGCGGGVMSGQVSDIMVLGLDTSSAPAPSTFTGRFTNVRFAPTGPNQNGFTLPDGATGEFEFCTFKKTGAGTPVGLASGTATTKFSYCKFNTVTGLAVGITNPLGATLADAFNIGNTSV